MTERPADARFDAPPDTAALPSAAADADAATATDTAPRPHRVTLLPARIAFDVGRGESVLEAALRAGVALPSSCRNGTCRSCLCRRIDGSVRYRVEWPGLSADEKRDAWMLPCVALPLSDLLIDAPRARLTVAAALPAVGA